MFVAVIFLFSLIGCGGVIDVEIQPESGYLDPCSLAVNEGFVVDYGHTERVLAGSLPKLWYYTQVSTCQYGNVVAWVGPYGSGAQREFDQFWNNCSGGQVVLLVSEPDTGEWKIGNGQYWCY